MKKAIAMLGVFMMGGCQVAQDVKEGIQEAPATFWEEIRSVVMFIVNTVFESVVAWLQGLLGV